MPRQEPTRVQHTAAAFDALMDAVVTAWQHGLGRCEDADHIAALSEVIERNATEERAERAGT